MFSFLLMMVTWQNLSKVTEGTNLKPDVIWWNQIAFWEWTYRMPDVLCNQITSFRNLIPYHLIIWYLFAFEILRFLGFRKSVLLDRRKLVKLLDLYNNRTISWDNFASSVQEAHKSRVVQPSCRQKLENKPKEEDYFYANPHECLANSSWCSEIKDPVSGRWADEHEIICNPAESNCRRCAVDWSQPAQSMIV